MRGSPARARDGLSATAAAVSALVSGSVPRRDLLPFSPRDIEARDKAEKPDRHSRSAMSPAPELIIPCKLPSRSPQLRRLRESRETDKCSPRETIVLPLRRQSHGYVRGL